MEHHRGPTENQGPVLVHDTCFVMVQIEVASAVLQIGITVCRKNSRLAGEIPCLMTILWSQSSCQFPPSYMQSRLNGGGSNFWAWTAVLFQVRINSSVIVSWKRKYSFILFLISCIPQLHRCVRTWYRQAMKIVTICILLTLHSVCVQYFFCLCSPVFCWREDESQAF